MNLCGISGKYALFADGQKAVAIDRDTGMVEDAGLLADLLILYPWKSEKSSIDSDHLGLAAAALAEFDIDDAVVAASGRMYTIPKGVQEEAKKALEWRREHKRGGTPVGLNTARTLANGGQIGIKKIRHIAKYFPRHAVDKKGKGYKVGSPGFPSNGRIAWALWGGDAAWKWARAIVERENKALRADGFSDYSADAYSSALYGTNMDAFEMAKAYEGTDRAPEFAARVRLDGTGIDRLYMIDVDGQALVWDSGDWNDLGHSSGDIYTYDRLLDDHDDLVEKHHILIDPDTALIISAHMQERPFACVNIDDLSVDEAQMVADAASEIDWVMVDAVMVAAGEPSGSGQVSADDGKYTPKERSENAARQVRDKSGRFAKMGGRVQTDSGTVGNIVRINPKSGTVSIKKDDGSVEEVSAKETRAYTEGPSPEGVTDRQPRPTIDQNPLDTSGILGQPRAPIDRPRAVIPGGLPALTPSDLRQIINDYPAWVMTQRANPPAASSPGTSTPASPQAPGLKAPGDRAPAHEKSDYITNLERATGKSLYTAPATEHPLLQKFFSKPANQLWYSPITSAADQKPEEKQTETIGQPAELTPDNSDVQPMYFAIVSPDDPAAVMDLASIVPASTKSTSPVTFKRNAGEWIRDDQILKDITSATPPPVVPLSGEEYADVLAQVDAATTASAWIRHETTLNRKIVDLYMSTPNPLVAEGGIDRNRGNAEKLRRYWLYGRGALKIRWNTPGDWSRCYRHLVKYMGPRAKGYCQLRHKEATGVYTGSKFNIGKRNIRGSALIGEYDLVDEAQVLEVMRQRAAMADARNRVLTAGGNGIETPMYGSKFMIPLVIPEGVETGDGRVFRKGSITIRELPLPLLWQTKTGDGHDGSVVVGRIDRMVRTENGIGNAYGVFDSGPFGREAERMVREKFLNGVSADLDRFEASEDEDDDENENNGNKKKIGSSKILVDKARVMAVTIVPKPAFEECKIYAMSDMDENNYQEAEMPVVSDGVYMDRLEASEAETLLACGMVADAIPVVPPAEWFNNPKLSGPTPLTVDDDGRVYGHIAAWHVDHIGMAYGTKPPRSKSNYAYFHTGVVRADDGKDYPVGQLTLSGGHASLQADAVQAARHYDDTGSAIADVHAGEDSYGIWVAGSLRPGATPEQVRALRASAPSGDWRPIKGSLELVAVCQVNVPGFPIARARVASGQVYALVAAGALELAKMKHDPMGELQRRLERIEDKVGLSTLDQIRAARGGAASTSAANTSLSVKAEALAIKVRSGIPYNELGYISQKTREKLAESGEALPDGSYPIRNVSELRDAVHAYGRSKPGKRAAVRRHIMKRARALKRPDLIPENWKSAGLIDDSVVSDLQARVASAKSNLETAGMISDKERSRLAESGEALPDGSYPIRNEEDLKNAVQAYGRANPSKRKQVRDHIMKRAREMDRADLIPENWMKSEAAAAAATQVDDAAVAALRSRVDAVRSELAAKGGEKKVWETDNPKKKSTPLTPTQKAAAKRSAAKAGRPYPNMVDNINAAKLSTDETDTPKA